MQRACLQHQHHRLLNGSAVHRHVPYFGETSCTNTPLFGRRSYKLLPNIGVPRLTFVMSYKVHNCRINRVSPSETTQSDLFPSTSLFFDFIYLLSVHFLSHTVITDYFFTYLTTCSLLKTFSCLLLLLQSTVNM